MDQLARPSTDKGAKKVSLAEQVYMRLRTEILHCQLPPGTELSEAELAARFEMSKTPVREALVTLRQEGLVLTFPRRGYQVAPITFGDMNELFDLRIMLEAGAVELACQRITDAPASASSPAPPTTATRSRPSTASSPPTATSTSPSPAPPTTAASTTCSSARSWSWSASSTSAPSCAT